VDERCRRYGCKGAVRTSRTRQAYRISPRWNLTLLAAHGAGRHARRGDGALPDPLHADPKHPRMSIETLFACVPALSHVDHTHPDSIISICCTPDGKKIATEIWGDRFVWVPYIRPGFTLSKMIVEAVKSNPKAEMVLMEKHGLVTWARPRRSATRARSRSSARRKSISRQDQFTWRWSLRRSEVPATGPVDASRYRGEGDCRPFVAPVTYPQPLPEGKGAIDGAACLLGLRDGRRCPSLRLQQRLPHHSPRSALLVRITSCIRSGRRC